MGIFGKIFNATDWSYKELQAIYRSMTAMGMMDGELDNEEITVTIDMLRELPGSESISSFTSLKGFIVEANKMGPELAFSTLQGMHSKKRKKAVEMLYDVAVADGNVDDKEKEFFLHVGSALNVKTATKANLDKLKLFTGNKYQNLEDYEITYLIGAPPRLLTYVEDRPNLYRLYKQLSWSIRNGYSVKQYLTEADLITDEHKFVISGGFLDILNIIRDILEGVPYPVLLEKNDSNEMTKDGKALKEAVDHLNLTEEQYNWIKLIRQRLKLMPLNTTADRTDLCNQSVRDLGIDHHNTYITDQEIVPENIRHEVALSRIDGLYGIQDIIRDYYDKEHFFHFTSSMIGAVLYAESLGINTDKYENFRIS